MTVTKILEQTLSAGSTSVIFTDAEIPNSLIRVYSSNSDLIPVSRILSGNTLTVTYEAQASAIDVAVEIVKAGLDIVDNLTSTDADKALSAKQGKLLKDDIDGVADDLDTLSDNLDTLSGNLDTLSDRVDNLDIPDNITDLNDVTVTNIQSGQVLAWDGTKFVNVDQSGGSSVNYSTTEQVIGTYLNDILYEKTTEIGAIPANSSNYQVTCGLTNVDKIVDIRCILYKGNSSFALPLSMLQSSSTFAEYGINLQAYDKSTDKLRIDTGTSRSLDGGHVTIRYTKTS